MYMSFEPNFGSEFFLGVGPMAAVFLLAPRDRGALRFVKAGVRTHLEEVPDWLQQRLAAQGLNIPEKVHDAALESGFEILGAT